MVYVDERRTSLERFRTANREWKSTIDADEKVMGVAGRLSEHAHETSSEKVEKVVILTKCQEGEESMFVVLKSCSDRVLVCQI